MGLLKSRKTTKKLMEAEPDPFKKGVYDGLQLAYKITANSLYGQIGARTSKIYKPQIAASTTAGGRARIIHARDFALREYPCDIKYGDTDSLMVAFKLWEDGEKISDREKIQRAISIGQDFEEKIKKELPGIHCLAYEKVLFPFVLISKKRYLALKYEDSPDTYKQISMGLVLKRRDNAPILKHCYLGVIDCIVKDRNIPNAITFVQDEIKKMIDGKFDMNMFVISKTLSSYYKDSDSIAHKVLADRMSERDPGNKPASNERIPYVFIKIKEEKGVEYLQGDRIEHINYVRKHNLQVDYEKYILNQIMKPISQLFELIVEKLPMFPYGKGYYEELHNIYYNKLNGDIDKTDTKIKKLKQAMVQKLIFQPLIDYAHLKVSNVKTLDSWFSQIDNPIENSIENSIENTIENSNIEVKEEKKVEKPKHEIKVKKTKQMSLDAFF
jgi:DNA polymerase elongation subunit (family B)